MRGSGEPGSTPVAIPAGASPVPPGLPETAPDVALLLGVGGTTEGTAVGAWSGAGAAPFVRGAGFALEPLPTGPRGNTMYRSCSVLWSRSLGKPMSWPSG